jgi:hypothetical protein
MSSFKDDLLDLPCWGARDIAVAANLVDKRGKPRVRAAYHLLEKGLLPADKVGRTYVSTPRRLRSIANGQAT